VTSILALITCGFLLDYSGPRNDRELQTVSVKELRTFIDLMSLEKNNYKAHVKWTEFRTENDEFRRHRPSKLPQQRESQGEFFVSGNKALWIEHFRDELEVVLGLNEKYAFRLTRNKKSGDTTLSDIFLRGASPDVEEEIKMKSARLIEIVPGIWDVSGIPVQVLFQSPGFKVRDIFPVHKDGKELMQVRFDHFGDFRAIPGRIKEGFWNSDPSMNWAIVESGCKHLGEDDEPLTETQSVRSLAVLDSGLPYAKERTTVRKLSKASNAETRIVTKIEIVSTLFDEQIFSLSHYNLPEPILDNGSPKGWYLLAFILVVLGVLGISLRKFYRR
jgi:hypothetical protein